MIQHNAKHVISNKYCFSNVKMRILKGRLSSKSDATRCATAQYTALCCSFAAPTGHEIRRDARSFPIFFVAIRVALRSFVGVFCTCFLICFLGGFYLPKPSQNDSKKWSKFRVPRPHLRLWPPWPPQVGPMAPKVSPKGPK